MIYGATEFTDKMGDSFTIRSLKPEDADALIRFVDQGKDETRFFPWSPGDTDLSPENAKEYIKDFEDAERKLLFGAFRGDDLLGLCELSNHGSWKKALHRCTIGVGVLNICQGRGIGRSLTNVLLAEAERAGYEQVEADVATDNELSYRNLSGAGFQAYGILPHKMKLDDGTYCDERRMVKWLK